MKIAILTFEGFNELDSFISQGILNRMKGSGWEVQICCPTKKVTSMNGVTIEAQQPLEYANTADVVLFGSGSYTRDIAKDSTILERLKLDPSRQLIGGQCSGALLMMTLGVLEGMPICTDLTTKPWLIEAGAEVLNQAFTAFGNVATAGGCLASKYLATWVIAKKAGIEAAESAIYYVAPVGEKDVLTKHCLSLVSAYLGESHGQNISMSSVLR